MDPLWDRLRTRVDLHWGYYGVVSIIDVSLLFCSCQGKLREEPRQALLPLVAEEPMSGDESAVGLLKDPLCCRPLFRSCRGGLWEESRGALDCVIRAVVVEKRFEPCRLCCLGRGALRTMSVVLSS
ncbi:hypothetical protein B296_00048110 [Ensete ventricosum]|uniref:Uncharacterized protein n=1 Tax=Ensete ventricosum TaxID=4639 RepID=A0A426YWA9_ENSVE|nr:hypothetical protein B296_00048110 [Ensete ventricosum]